MNFKFMPELVVSYLKTTSNHNLSGELLRVVLVVSYLKTTSNHNGVAVPCFCQELYLI